MPSINFFCEDVIFNIKHKRKLKDWIKQTIKTEGFKLSELNFIFCSDEYLLRINIEYLSHTTYTDIITFDNSDVSGSIAGDIFISTERILENALKYEVIETDELHRVIIHGTLHLLGYNDKTKADKSLMAKKEDQYLALRN